MIDLKKLGEAYMWKATFNDGREIEEFYENENKKIKETDFSIIQKKEGLEKFELIGQETEISFNKDGIFNIAGRKVEFEIKEKESGIDLLEGTKNNLIMFRTNYKDVSTGIDRVSIYSFGYKIETSLAYVSLYFFNGVEGNGFKIKITGKEEFDILLKIKFDDKEMTPHEIHVFKNKAITISM